MKTTEVRATTSEAVSLAEIARVFLVIGSVGFGGGSAIIALIQDYCVTRRRWLGLDEFSHGVALGQIMGPFAVNASIFVGYRLRGWKGAAAAAVAFLTPSVILVMVLTALYEHFHQVPSLQAALNGIAPVVVALIVAAAFQMGRGRVRSVSPVLLLLAAMAAQLAGVPIVAVLLAAAVLSLIRFKFAHRKGAALDPAV